MTTYRKRATVGIADLIQRTGGNRLKAVIRVDQVYAQIQHEAMEFKHVNGGQAKYLEIALTTRGKAAIGVVAKRLLRRTTILNDEWQTPAKEVIRGVEVLAPREFGDLRHSGSYRIFDGTRVVHRQAAIQPRLTPSEIDAKAHLRSMGVGYRGGF